MNNGYFCLNQTVFIAMSGQMEHEVRHLDQCIREIENKVQWGRKEEWTNYHFTRLSDDIFQSTSVRLSVSSIRRLLGQDKSYKEKFNPQIETKNALAKYLGFESWSAFKEKFNKTNPSKTKISRRIIILSGGTLVIIAFIIWMGTIFYNRIFPEEYYFSGRNLSGYHPHTAAFHYDISGLHGDEIYIDFGELYNPTGKLELLPKTENIVTHTYFNSYYYNVLLIYKNKPIAHEKVLVLSDGWDGGVIQNNEYYLIDKALLINDSSMNISASEAAIAGVDTTRDFEIEYKNVADFDITDSKFSVSFDVLLRRRFNQNNCSFLEMLLLATESDAGFKLANTGCSSMTSFFAGDSVRNGRYDELQSLAYNLMKWNTIRFDVSDNTAKLYVNETLIYKLGYTQSLGSIKCIHLKFSGYGIVDNVEFRNNQNTVVYNETFDNK